MKVIKSIDPLISWQGNLYRLQGKFLSANAIAPSQILPNSELQQVNFPVAQQYTVLLSCLSVDTSISANAIRLLNDAARAWANASLLVVSQDLPFALARFQQQEKLQHVQLLSAFNSGFAEQYGVQIIDGPFAGLNAGAIWVVNADQRIVYSERLIALTDEPDYAAISRYIKN